MLNKDILKQNGIKKIPGVLVTSVKYLLPALLPSWRFFDVIAPSPRIQFHLSHISSDFLSEWHEFRPRPESVDFYTLMRRMIWNPLWNESLYMVTCAERLIEDPDRHSENEILKRIIRDLASHQLNIDPKLVTHIKFRLVVIQREKESLIETVAFQSRLQRLLATNL